MSRNLLDELLIIRLKRSTIQRVFQHTLSTPYGFCLLHKPIAIDSLLLQGRPKQ